MNEHTPFQTPQVRHLAWACFADPLILTAGLSDAAGVHDCVFTLTPRRRAWLEQLDRNPRPLLEHLAGRRSHRLGIYFESLWLFFLEQEPECELLAHNLPIHHQGRTLGEFDCLYFCHAREQVVHLELAVKFFLGLRPPSASTGEARQRDAPASRADQWLGPDARDRLDLKLAHLLQRQIRLSGTPAAQAALQALDIEVQRREIAFRGYLFAPRGAPLAPPPGFNPGRELHTHLTRSEYDRRLPDHPTTGFIALPKMQWLGPAMVTDATEIFDAEAMGSQLDAHFAHSRYPFMLASLDAFGREQYRWFITTDDWPGSLPNENSPRN